jgi:hypothetical protein
LETGGVITSNVPETKAVARNLIANPTEQLIPMKLSSERRLTTHVGSLPRPQEVVDLLFAQERGEPFDPATFDATMRRGVAGATG